MSRLLLELIERFPFFSSQQKAQTQTPPRQPEFDSTTSSKGVKSANSSEQLPGSTPKRSVNENDVQVNIITSVTGRFIFSGPEHYFCRY